MRVAVYFTDDSQVGRSIAPLVRSLDMIVVTCSDLKMALAQFEDFDLPIVCIIDGRAEDVVNQVDTISAFSPKARFISIVSEVSVADVRALMKRGVFECLLDPANPFEIVDSLSRMASSTCDEHSSTQRTLSLLTSMSSRRFGIPVMTPNIEWEIIMLVITYYQSGREIYISELASLLDVPLPTMRRKVHSLRSRGLLNCAESSGELSAYSIEPTLATLIKIAKLTHTKSLSQLHGYSEETRMDSIL